MDFRNRNGQPAQQVHSTPVAATSGQAQHEAPKHHVNWETIPKWIRIVNVVLLFSITIIALAVVLLMRNNNPNESQYIAKDNYQAVFLENGQVYFGKISALNQRFINLQNIFYLNSQSQSSSENKETNKTDQFTLIKLGCELHGPGDQMIINRDKITFWENLKDDGQVVKTINEWIKQNPNGQKCSTTSSTGNTTGSTSQSTTNTTQNATNNNGTSTGTSGQ